MDLIDEADQLSADQLRDFITASARRIAADLELGPQATRCLDDALETLGTLDAQLMSFDTFNDADHRDNRNRADNDPTRTTALGALTALLIGAQRTHGHVDAGYVTLLAQGADDTDANLWATYAALTGVPAEHLELWVSLAPDWTGTATELTAACRPALATAAC